MHESSGDPTLSEILEDHQLRANLIRKAQQGDDWAFRVLYKCYRKPIWAHLWHMVGDKDVADDLFQETFVCAWQHLAEVDCHSPFTPWLYKIAASRAVDYLRRNKKITFSPLAEQDIERHVVDPEKLVGNDQCFEIALGRLTPQTRICLLLYDQWGFSVQEIAGMLKIALSTVRAYISRGRPQFEEEYRRLTGEGPSVQRKEKTTS
jgi:RNA polymerase sigma-70 factor (ECF subfamily)